MKPSKYGRLGYVVGGVCLLSTALLVSHHKLRADESRPLVSAQEQANFRKAADYSANIRGLSVLIMRHGQIIFEEYHNGHTAETPHPLASGTKSFTGIIAAAAADDGLLQFDDKVSDTITEWKTDPRKSKITIRQLLSQTSGLEVGDNGRPPAYSESIKLGTKFEPGTTFEYGPAVFQDFGELMRRKLAAKNETPLDYLKRRVLNPIGLKVAYWTHQDGEPNMPSGAMLTTREWAKYGQFLLQDGQWNGKQLIAKKYLDQCFMGSKTNPNYGLSFWLNRSFDGSAHVADNAAVGRLQQMLGREIEGETTQISKRGFGEKLPHDMVTAAGAGKQRLYVIPSLDMVIVRQGQQSRFDDNEFLSLLLGV